METTRSVKFFSDFLLGMTQELAGRLACINVEAGLINVETTSSLPARFHSAATVLGQIYALKNTQVNTLYKDGKITFEQAEKQILRVVHSACLQARLFWKQDIAAFERNKSAMRPEHIAQAEATFAKHAELLDELTPYFVGPEQKRMTEEEVLAFDLQFDPLYTTEEAQVIIDLRRKVNEVTTRLEEAQVALRTEQANHETTRQQHDAQIGRMGAAAEQTAATHFEDLKWFRTLMNQQSATWSHVRKWVETMVHQNAQVVLAYEANKNIRMKQLDDLAKILGCTAHFSSIEGRVRMLADRDWCGTCRNEREFKTHEQAIRIPCPTCRPVKLAVDVTHPVEGESSKVVETRDGTGKLVGISITAINPPVPQNAAVQASSDLIAHGLGLPDGKALHQLHEDTKPYFFKSDVFTTEMLQAARSINANSLFSVQAQDASYYENQLFLMRYAAAYQKSRSISCNRVKPDGTFSRAHWPKPEVLAKYLGAIQTYKNLNRVMQISADPATNMDNEFKRNYELVAKEASEQEHLHGTLL